MVCIRDFTVYNHLVFSEKRNVFSKLTGPHFINQTERCNTIITSPEGDGVILIGNA